VKDRDDSETSAEASQSLLSQLPSFALFLIEEEKLPPVDTSVWFEESMLFEFVIAESENVVINAAVQWLCQLAV